MQSRFDVFVLNAECALMCGRLGKLCLLLSVPDGSHLPPHPATPRYPNKLAHVTVHIHFSHAIPCFVASLWAFAATSVHVSV